MKFKFLLFIFLVLGSALSAQDYIYEDTINHLVITEARYYVPQETYLELTNMGNDSIQLDQFWIGRWQNGSTFDVVTGEYTNISDKQRIPVDKKLGPDESYVFAVVYDYAPKLFARTDGNQGIEKRTPDSMWELADYHVHIDEDGDSIDDKKPTFGDDVFTEQWWGSAGFFIEQFLVKDGQLDSVVIDQVNGIFTDPDGTQVDRGTVVDVAGVEGASGNSVLIRRNSVTTGTLDFFNARGVGLDDSEWIPVPFPGSAWREPFWTVGNHGDYNLDENTLESDVVEVDFANKTLTVPWGIWRGDDIMNYFVKKPGIAWEYIMAADADSLTHAAQTGDELHIYVCGNDLDFAAFDIVVKEPAADANMVVPVANEGWTEGWQNTQVESGNWPWPRITKHESGIDTIWGVLGGIPYATRVDSLLERLEKPANAEWEIVYADGVAKPDLANSDKLKVTAQDGSVKEYFISVNHYIPDNNASLSAIHWPDIPEFYKGIFGWMGDTIPGFGSQVFNYNIEVPLIAEGVPALVAQKSNINATVQVDRAKSLSGSVEDRTINFTVTAEDDTTQNIYSVVLTKEKDPDNLQPYKAEPFFSEVVHNFWWRDNHFLEICNPGTERIDLSEYMIVGGTNPNPAELIVQTNEDDWLMRYEKYIPGYKWAPNEAEWALRPYEAELDLAVNAVIEPGDVFVLGAHNRSQPRLCDEGYVYPGVTEVDVQFTTKDFNCFTINNQWGEEAHYDGTPMGKGLNKHIFLFKILNDSVRQGTKPATDPNDFELIDLIGMGSSEPWQLPGEDISAPAILRRKPSVTIGNPEPGVSMGINSPEDVEWDHFDHKSWDLGGFHLNMKNVVGDLGKHFFNAPTRYMSTVNSVVYKVSEGYGKDGKAEEIRGVTSGTIVSDFLDNIIKSDSLQALTVTSTQDGSVLLPGDLLTLNDTLTVLSADSTNRTKYVLNVTEEGLSSDAVLTSDRYDIDIDQIPAAVGEAESIADGHMGTATITGFGYGTALQTVVNNVEVPFGASMTVVSEDGSYVPFKKLNYDTAYVAVTVNSETYFEVVAENGITTIMYQLLPQSLESDAFVTSDVYSVSQGDLLIDLVPRGTNVRNFLTNLIPSMDATIKVLDKWGFVRTDGTVADDDKLVVTSPDGTVTTVYHIAKLATQYILEPTYLAYILSNVYSIDQVDYVIYNASGTADISEFYSRIEAAAGATAVVVDSDGNEKTTGDLDGNDKVKVTSADGKIVVMYTFGPLVDASEFRVQNQIELYPNPTNGKLNVTGVEKGQRIQIYNAVGTAVLDVNVESNHEILNIDNHPAGMYLIVVSDENQLLGKYKAIKY